MIELLLVGGAVAGLTGAGTAVALANLPRPEEEQEEVTVVGQGSDSLTLSSSTRAAFGKASKVKMEHTEWLIPDLLERGVFTIIGGDPKVGKSTMACSMAALMSKGGEWLGQKIKPFTVFILETEDNFAKVTLPRLTAAGANPNNILKGKHINLSIPENVEWVKKFVKDNIGGMPPLGLIIISPMVTFFGSGAKDDDAVRERMKPLLDWVEEANAALIGVAHTTPASKGKTIDYVGSATFARVARSAVNIIFNEDDPSGEQRLLFGAGGNNGKLHKGMPFHIEEVKLSNGIKTTRVAWDDHKIESSEPATKKKAKA